VKKKLKLKKTTIKKLQLKLKPRSDRKVAPLYYEGDYLLDPSGGHNGAGCTSGSNC
jgi:hypothetical protein